MKKRILTVLLGAAYVGLLTAILLLRMRAGVSGADVSGTDGYGALRAALSLAALAVPWAIVLWLYLRIGQDDGRQGDNGQDRIGQNRAGQDSAGQDKVKQDGSGQNGVRADGSRAAASRQNSSEQENARPAADMPAVLSYEAFTAAMASCGLTRRETEVAWLLYRGYTNRQISGELYVAETTVKKHVSHIFEKTGVSCRKEFRNRAGRTDAP